MKRIDFLKKLGIGLGVAVIAPSVVANNATSETMSTEQEWRDIFQTLADSYRMGYKEKAGIIGFESDYYCIGDVFSRNNEKYICVRKISNSDGRWELLLRPINPQIGGDIIVQDTKDLSDFFYYYRESILINTND